MCAHAYTDGKGKGKLMCRCYFATLEVISQFVNMVFVNMVTKSTCACMTCTKLI